MRGSTLDVRIWRLLTSDSDVYSRSPHFNIQGGGLEFLSRAKHVFQRALKISNFITCLSCLFITVLEVNYLFHAEYGWFLGSHCVLYNMWVILWFLDNGAPWCLIFSEHRWYDLVNPHIMTFTIQDSLPQSILSYSGDIRVIFGWYCTVQRTLVSQIYFVFVEVLFLSV